MSYRIENAVMKVCDYLDSQRKEVDNWKNYSDQQLWIELVSCILGSRVRYETAKACAMHLQNTGLLRISLLLKRPKNTEDKIRRELSRSIYPPFSGVRGSKYRFPKYRSRFIVSTGIQIYKEDSLTIESILSKSHGGQEARSVFVKYQGIGPKQASLFLRNISFSDDLAILDCHVIHYMKLLNLNEKYSHIFQKRMHTYLMNENILRLYALSKRRALAILDIAIWTVMRLIQRRLYYYNCDASIWRN